MRRQNLDKYKIASHSVSKSKQVLMLYEGAIRFLKKAKEAALENQIEKRFENLEKFCQIINGLSASLDYAKGGEISEILRKFYLSIYLRVNSLHRKNNLPLYDEIIEEMSQMLESWREIDNEFSKQNSENKTNL